MINSISPEEMKAWRRDRYDNIARIELGLITQGKRLPKTKKVVTEQEALIFKVTRKSNILKHENMFSKEFAKYAGKKANTAKIFEKCILRTAKKETETTFSA